MNEFDLSSCASGEEKTNPLAIIRSICLSVRPRDRLCVAILSLIDGRAFHLFVSLHVHRFFTVSVVYRLQYSSRALICAKTHLVVVCLRGVSGTVATQLAS